MKKIVIIIFCIYSFQINAQINLSYTKEQMLEDFDFFYGKLDSVNSQLEIIKQVTGIDVLAEIRNIRPAIDTITTDNSFYDCLYRALLLCKNPHNSFTTNYPYKDKDSILINTAKQNYWKFIDPVSTKYDTGYNPFEVYYINGEYFVPNIYDKNNNIQIPEKSKILKINNLPVHEYIQQWELPLSDWAKWDNDNKRFYLEDFLSPKRVGQSDKFVVTYLFQNEIKEVDIKSFYTIFANSKGYFTPRVNYFDKDKILYIRIPEMDYEMIEDYKRKIVKYREHTIDKIIIDVRGNGGGADKVWEEILSVIIDKSIKTPQKLAFRDNCLVKKYLEKEGIIYNIANIGDEILQIGKDSFFYLLDERKIDVSDNSLNYAGKIYVLVDGAIFSSTKGFVSFCMSTNKLITVGSSSDFIGGQGITPFHFILPNSNLIFCLENSLDCTNDIKKTEDFYINSPKIIIESNIDGIFKNRNTILELYSEDYLYNVDPVFQKILTLSNN